MANGADPDQLASSEANWSGSTLFAKPDISGFSRTWVKADLCFVRACCWWDIKTWTLTQTTTVQHSLKWIHRYIQVDDEPLLTYFTDTSRVTEIYTKNLYLTLVLLNKLRCHVEPTSNFQPIRLLDLDCCYDFTYLMTNSANPDQLASSDLHCLQSQGISRFSRTRVNVWFKSGFENNSHAPLNENDGQDLISVYNVLWHKT